MVILFNIICFVTPAEVGGYSKYDGAFWPGYGFIMLTFIVHMAFAVKLLDKTRETPVNVISFIELIIMVFASGACMAIPNLPIWIGVIVCGAVLVFSIIFIIMAKTAGDRAVSANAKLNNKVSLMREITGDAQLLMAKATSENDKRIAKAIYEAVRFSDPVSDGSLQAEEHAIMKLTSEIGVLMENGSTAEILNSKADELLKLIELRNIKCRENKRKV